MKELPEWYYDELIQIGTDYESEEEVMQYDRKMGSIRNIPKEAETMCKLISIQPDNEILEVGCGTGEFSIELSKHCKQVTALDISQKMLDFAEKKARSRQRDNIRFIKAGFLTFDSEETKYDAVVTQLVLHHLPDFWKFIALKNINSMLKSGGKFFLKDVVFSSDTPDFDTFFPQLFRNIPDEADDKVVEEMKLHIKEEYSTFDWTMKGLIEQAGFQIQEHDHKNGFMASYLCIKQ
ncbi:methylase involved in ubiquinone/menaquinone biosynthesis [Methanolobus tindarius DSM 2278]|uniref:Methylase involved in ubiquinone/menaquinone biosynthesis n=1 Tax=Methanolobus tindarius DSM 2278 TaxID=1090322 RepID=W9DWY3_METTI|nr:class I SAM-dependent methyltransferase [Methanolobus tindarius]ETA68192.1 methylase involved in ubiquinone/menaquinone biosynthesis [Methanolobus tindarius DSM 2278]